jgi:NitT/TauT family transport system ATP-binding protein
MAGDSGAAKVRIEQVVKKFNTRNGEVVALNGVDLEIAKDEFVCVVGPSGCGKSTLLNLIAGLSKPTSGKVLVNGKEVEGPGAERGVVFQQYALFPWLTVKKNVEYGLKLQGLNKKEASAVALKYLEMVDLRQFENAYPKELSGGMKQRVAIARAYAVKPQVLLMDEPFGALDAQTKTQLQSELIHTWIQEKRTVFFITHDVEEAVTLAQRVIVMSARPGRIREIINVDLPYPRNQKIRISKEFVDIKNRIWAEVYEEYMAMRK